MDDVITESCKSSNESVDAMPINSAIVNCKITTLSARVKRIRPARHTFPIEDFQSLFQGRDLLFAPLDSFFMGHSCIDAGRFELVEIVKSSIILISSSGGTQSVCPTKPIYIVSRS